MSLAEQIAAHAKTQGAKCKIGQYLAQSSTAHRTELQAILDEPDPKKKLGHATVARWFTKAQHVKMAAGAVSSHRARTCSCYAEPLRGSR
jgi:hypothetical protein